VGGKGNNHLFVVGCEKSDVGSGVRIIPMVGVFELKLKFFFGTLFRIDDSF
jgi:hypothetical protein